MVVLKQATRLTLPAPRRALAAFNAEGRNEGMCNLDALHDAVSPILLRRRKSAVEDELPGRTSKTYKTGMTPEQDRRYRSHLSEVASLYELSKRRPLTPKEQERLQIELGMMRMLCDTCYILDPEIKDSPKLDEFEDVLDDIFADDPERLKIIAGEADLTPEKAREIIDQIHTYPPVKHAMVASMCGRACDTACYVHLEEKGVLKRKFNTPFRKRPVWTLPLD